MYNRIISFLYENNILSEARNGFRKGKSIDTAVQSFIGRIQKVLDKWVHTTGIFIELTKAYDVLNHKFLLESYFITVYGAPLNYGLGLIWHTENNLLKFVKVNQAVWG